jgi:glutathione S-transferase
MAHPYRIFGMELSPYSVKVRSYFRYKQIPHEWIVRTPATQAEYQKFARLPLIPAVATPEGEGLQDSTVVLEALEARFPVPSIHPEDAGLAFLSALVEEFGDEWGNKWMFHYRWWREIDQRAGAARIAETMLPRGATKEQREGAVEMVRQRMVSRIGFVGSSEATADQIEASFRDAMQILERHLTSRPYLFGERPAFGDFGLWAQVYECSTDPTPGAWLAAHAPHVMRWVERMLEPKTAGAFEDWDDLGATFAPLLRDQVGALFLPWSDANARALAAGEERLTVELAGRRFEQEPQKYHAKSLTALRARYRTVPAADRARLDPVLEAADCLRWLAPGDS